MVVFVSRAGGRSELSMFYRDPARWSGQGKMMRPASAMENQPSNTGRGRTSPASRSTLKGSTLPQHSQPAQGTQRP
jgi:hypothetical protein